MRKKLPSIPRSHTFLEFQTVNRIRCVEAFRHLVDTTNAKWPWYLWALCVAGESGELCNRVKKILRGDNSLESQREKLLGELADVITYSDLMISALGADTEQVIWKKFNTVSRRRGWKRK